MPIRFLAFARQVWDAISDAGKFGIWFGAELHGQFAANANLAGKLVPTNSHPGLGRAQQALPGSTFTISIIESPGRASCRSAGNRWLLLRGGYPAEPVTLVSFELDEIAGQQWTDQAVSRCLRRPRELAILVEKFLSSTRDLRRTHHP